MSVHKHGSTGPGCAGTCCLKVSGLGVSDAISGKCVYVIIPHLGIQRSFYIDEDTHKYTRECHTMTLKLNDVNL